MKSIMVNRNVLEFLQVFHNFVINVLSFYFFVPAFSFVYGNQ